MNTNAVGIGQDEGHEEEEVGLGSIWVIGHVGKIDEEGEAKKTSTRRGLFGGVNEVEKGKKIDEEVETIVQEIKDTWKVVESKKQKNKKKEVSAEKQEYLKVMVSADGETKDICGIEAKKKKLRTVGYGEITVDSAAEESVWPYVSKDTFPMKPVEKKMRFITASGDGMGHYGKKQVHFKTKESKTVAGMNFEVTDVCKPLAAVWRLAEKNHLVQFGPAPEDCFIKNKETGNKIFMKQKKGSYVLQVEFVQEVDAEEVISRKEGQCRVCDSTDPSKGFRRQA
jgi:hypothetical protein